MPLDFPFEAARDLAVRARTLAGDLRRLELCLDGETDALVPRRLRGAFATWFVELRLGSVAALRAQAGHLEEQADLAEALVSVATRRRADRRDELEHWERRRAAWKVARTDATAGW